MTFANTQRNVQEPVTVQKPGAGGQDEAVTTHPAFAQISASRVSGRSHFYGSDFGHNAHMTIRIARSELHRSLHRDWHFERDAFIEVALTESQWATFVSSPNMGSGVPCTLTRQNGQLVPGLPAPESRTQQFSAEMRETMGKALAALEEVSVAIDAMGLPKAKAAALKEKVRFAHMQVHANAPFAAASFDKHMEGTVEKAKAEVHGFLTGVMMRAGVDALAGRPLLEIEHRSEESAE